MKILKSFGIQKFDSIICHKIMDISTFAFLRTIGIYVPLHLRLSLDSLRIMSLLL